ncbi:MAG: CheR family methyltransferase [Candidatus Tyrphobacter sp.]
MEVASVEFRELRDRIRKRLGLYFDDSKEEVLRRRLQSRIRACGVRNIAEYCRILDAAPAAQAEWDELASLLANGESYFFRQRGQLDVVAGPILAECRRRSQRLRVWSAACASGEEPYSVAMSLLENGQIRQGECSILASDLSLRAIERAKAGLYQEFALRATPPAIVEKYFRPLQSWFRIEDRVKAMVRFTRLNLLDAHAVASVGMHDAVFCRNVLMYFERGTQEAIARSFARVLRPGGYLFLGYAESFVYARDLFEPVVSRDALYFRRTDDAAH